MKELKIILDDGTGLYIAWDKNPVATKYVVLGKDNTFNDTILCETTDNKIFIDNKDLKGIVGVTVEYIFFDEESQKEAVFERTNSYIRKLNAYKMMDIRSIESYYGITLSFATSTIYDKYFIYEKDGDDFKKIMETEDFQVTSPKFKEGNTYYIEAYTKEDNTYKLKSKSFEYVCEPTWKDPTFIEPKVSIIIPTYNCCRFLTRAIDSLILSTLEEKEIVIVDDGSTDKTKEVLEWYKKKYPTLIKVFHKKNDESEIDFIFDIEKETKGTYYIKELEFYMDAKVKTIMLIREDNYIEVEYKLWLQDEEIGNFIFKLKVKE